MSLAIRRAAVCAVFALAAAPALAASPDAQFAMVAAQGGLAEVQTAQLALQKSRNSTVRAFAQRMVTDHTANNARLASIMRSEGLTVPTTVDPNSRKMMTRLQSLSGRAFNRAYLAGQVRGHQQMQILMQSEINGGKDARLKAFAKSTLPTVNMHLAMAKTDVAKVRNRRGGSMGSSMGGSMSGMNHGTMGGSTQPARGMPSGTGPMTSPMPMGSPMPMSSSMPMSSPRPISH